MPFDEELRIYLEEVERIASAKDLVRHRRVDEGALRRHFLESLRELEESAPGLIRSQFERWSPRVEELGRYVETLPLRDAPVRDDEALAFACRALDLGLGLGLPSSEARMTLVDELEVDRIVAAFQRRGAMEPYALENQLLRRTSSTQTRVTDLGRVFLRLRGKDAVRWLLTVEVAQSQGPRDPWRTSRELLEQAFSSRGIMLEDESRFPFNLETVGRLEHLGVIQSDLNPLRAHGQIASSMRDVVRHVLDGGPWHAAVAALLDDERADVLPLSGSRATEASIEQTRMVAHEVRNALIPVRHDIDALLKTSDPASRARLDSSKRGVVRVLAFVDEMVATSELLREPLTSFEIGDAIRDAIGWLDGGERVQVDVSTGPVKIRSRRSRLQRAISNVVLNALQATNAGQPVRVQVHRSARMIEIIVDDGGPGVPEQSRSLVFDDGFTTRGGVGGSGFGLAYVRRVVDELGGRVWCEAADLGGARFVMALPEGEADL